MHNKIKLFLKTLEGYWLSTQTIYYIPTRKIINRKNKNYLKYIQNNEGFNQIIIADENNLPNTYHFILKNYKQEFIGETEKKTLNRTYCGQFKLYSSYCMKIIYNKENINHIEYIIKCTKNFQLSIGFIKIKKNYVAAKFTSRIKILIN